MEDLPHIFLQGTTCWKTECTRCGRVEEFATKEQLENKGPCPCWAENPPKKKQTAFCKCGLLAEYEVVVGVRNYGDRKFMRQEKQIICRVHGAEVLEALDARKQ